MANYQVIAERLQKGETVTFRPHGNSMTPYIKDGQEVTVRPFKDNEPMLLEDIVLAKVHGRFYLHRIVNVDMVTQRVLIGNAHGHVNGWTSQDKIYGILVEE